MRRPKLHHPNRSWRQVADEYTRRTGRPITAENCRAIHQRALAKLQKAVGAWRVR